VIAIYEINGRSHAYSSIAWNVLEYLALFVIVLLHEFGHALACKQTGGTANRIMLWPLGGVAYVSPPPRAAANLWSIAAGPLVNVALVVIFKLLGIFFRAMALNLAYPNLFALLQAVAWINLGLLIFNLLPVYPLDGGQILRSLLWFVFGRARSLMIAAVLGILGVIGLFAFAIKIGSTWIGIISLYVLINCWNGLKSARALSKVEKLPRRDGVFACPSCKAAPHIGPIWRCSACTNTFDTFETRAQCPACNKQFAKTRCLDCGAQHALDEWAHRAPVFAQTAVTSH
jgi:Zn-dependent protease